MLPKWPSRRKKGEKAVPNAAKLSPRFDMSLRCEQQEPELGGSTSASWRFVNVIKQRLWGREDRNIPKARMKKLVLATTNKDKIREIKDVLRRLDVEILSLEDYPEIPPVVEGGHSFEENAVKKAQLVYQFTGLPSLADDSGLEVDYLGGAPGVLSSRFAGEGASYEDNNQKLLRLLKGVPKEKRTARFRCVLALASRDKTHIIEEKCEGLITDEPKGKNGFGYDPVFLVPELGKTFAEMGLDLKNKISHRGKALRKLKKILEDFLLE